MPQAHEFDSFLRLPIFCLPSPFFASSSAKRIPTPGAHRHLFLQYFSKVFVYQVEWSPELLTNIATNLNEQDAHRKEQFEAEARNLLTNGKVHLRPMISLQMVDWCWWKRISLPVENLMTSNLWQKCSAKVSSQSNESNLSRVLGKLYTGANFCTIMVLSLSVSFNRHKLRI